MRFCRFVALREIGEHNHILADGRYVGVEIAQDDSVALEEQFADMKEMLLGQSTDTVELNAVI